MKFKVGDKVRYVGKNNWSFWERFVPNYKSLTAEVKRVLDDGRIGVGYKGYGSEWVQMSGDKFVKLEGGLYVNKRRSDATVTSTSTDKSDGG